MKKRPLNNWAVVCTATFLAVLVAPTEATYAGLVTLYNPVDSYQDDTATFPQTFYTLFQALSDEQLAGLAVNYDPGPANSDPRFYWSMWTSNANGTLGTEILQIADYSAPIGSTDPGFGTYETTVALTLQTGHYYVVAFQANNDPNSIRIDYPTQPFVTSDGNFSVLAGGASALISVNNPVFAAAQFSLDVVPEPSSLVLFGIAVFAFASFARRRERRQTAKLTLPR